MLEAIWQAAEILPVEKQKRLVKPFLEGVAASGDAGLLHRWESRLNTSFRQAVRRDDYATRKARSVLRQGDWNAFLRMARQGERPFNIGRPEIMASGVRLAPDDATRARVMDAMFDLAGPPQKTTGFERSFEQAHFGHALAELSMEGCDLKRFDRAIALTVDPDSLRYTMWRRRITGSAGDVSNRIMDDADPEDTRHVRAALEGYGAILRLGYCS